MIYGHQHKLGHLTSSVSPDGRYVAFMSDRSLTGYDNIDASSGQRDEEVYLYDAQSGRLVCASCNPTGARPVGRFEQYGLDGDLQGTWSASISRRVDPRLAQESEVIARYQPRFLSEDGRVFFDSSDALVPQDTNGTEDVYEFEPEGIGRLRRLERHLQRTLGWLRGADLRRRGGRRNRFSSMPAPAATTSSSRPPKSWPPGTPTASTTSTTPMSAAPKRRVRWPPVSPSRRRATRRNRAKRRPRRSRRSSGRPSSATFAGAGNACSGSPRSLSQRPPPSQGSSGERRRCVKVGRREAEQVQGDR